MNKKDLRTRLLKNINIYNRLKNYFLYSLFFTIAIKLIWIILNTYIISRFQKYLPLSIGLLLEKLFHSITIVTICLTLLFLVVYLLIFLIGCYGVSHYSLERRFLRTDFKLSKKQTTAIRQRFYKPDNDDFNQLIDTLIIDIRGSIVFAQIDYPNTHSLTCELEEYLTDIRNFIAYTNENYSFSNFSMKSKNYILIGNKK